MKLKRFCFPFISIVLIGIIADAAVAQNSDRSNEQIASPALIENSYPLAVVNIYKEAHWNLSGPIYLPLHEYYDAQAEVYSGYVDVLAERVLSMGHSVDGRYPTITRTTRIPTMPAGYMSDNQSLKLLVERVTVLQKNVYRDIKTTEETDPPTSNV